MSSSVLPDGPTRLLSPPPPAAEETLPIRINAATRQIHSSLNKLVTSRLLFAIPPHTTDPTLYLHGIHTFAQLYFTFEDSWQDLICAHLSASSPFVPPVSFLPSPPDSANSSPLPSPALHHDKLRTLLATLIPPTLWRTQRLEDDILYLTKRFSVVLPNANADPLLKELQAHIAKAADNKPHVLLAYSWVLYMAIFSGGRWIRAKLQAAGPEFWGHEDALMASPKSADNTVSSEIVKEENTRRTHGQDGMRLFHFDGPEDGEDIKRFFKEKFLQADDLLSEREKEDVVAEADWIFRSCVRLVEDLDIRLATPIDQTAPIPSKLKQADSRPLREDRNEKGERLIPASMRPFLPQGSFHNPTRYPGAYITKGLEPFEVMLVVALGIGGWYLLHTFGVVGIGAMSTF